MIVKLLYIFTCVTFASSIRSVLDEEKCDHEPVILYECMLKSLINGRH